MAMHDYRPKAFGMVKKRVPDPAQVGAALLLNGNPRPDPGVNEQVIAQRDPVAADLLGRALRPGRAFTSLKPKSAAQ